MVTCYSPVRRSTRIRRYFRARLACLIHAANVRSEPGSNPSIELISVAPSGVDPTSRSHHSSGNLRWKLLTGTDRCAHAQLPAPNGVPFAHTLKRGHPECQRSSPSPGPGSLQAPQAGGESYRPAPARARLWPEFSRSSHATAHAARDPWALARTGQAASCCIIDGCDRGSVPLAERRPGRRGGRRGPDAPSP